ncbi:hypothetical protein MJH12_12600 [bacterium]|nr:hypothetical protein [bacterium]
MKSDNWNLQDMCLTDPFSGVHYFSPTCSSDVIDHFLSEQTSKSYQMINEEQLLEKALDTNDLIWVL